MPGPTVRDRPPAAGSSAASDQADETPPWLETAVHNLAAATLGDRVARLAGAPPERAACRSPPPRDLSPAAFWCAAAAAVLALAALAGTPLRTSRANFATVPEPDSAALVSASQSARTEQLISASLGALGGALHDATARGDEAVAAAARTEAALHQAERERSGAKAALSAVRSELRAVRDALRAKEDALGRLEDLHALAVKGHKQAAACCEAGRAERAARLVTYDALARCSRELDVSERRAESAAKLAEARGAQLAAVLGRPPRREIDSVSRMWGRLARMG